MRRVLLTALLLVLCVGSARAATLISKATGNFTAAGTWNSIADATACELDSEAGNTALTTSYVYTATFIPDPNEEIDAVAVKVITRSTSTDGTITIQLYNNTTAAEVWAVTLNVVDIGPNPGWYVFKATPHTPNGTDVYKIGAKTSVASRVTLYRDSTPGNWSRMLRRTATAAPGVDDKLHVAGECTAAATCSSFVVTMDNTASTSFGPTVSGGPPQGMTVNNYGTLAYATAAGSYYLLTLKGILRVNDGGTMTIGDPNNQMDPNSTGTLVMASAANVDSGLYVDNGGTFLTAGAPGRNPWSLMTISRGGYCTVSGGVDVSATAGQAQSFIGLTGDIVINGVTRTISSVTDATHLVLTTSTTNTTTPVQWTHAGSAATVTVQSTAGWKADDVIAVAATDDGQTQQSESATIATVDSSTQITLTAPLAYVHLGEAPTQAEVVNLTRNVVVRGASSSLQGYVTTSATSTTDSRDTEYMWLGSATTGKRGFTCYGPCAIDDCSFHDHIVTSSYGILVDTNSPTVSITDTVMYYLASSGLYSNNNCVNCTVDDLVSIRGGGLFIYLNSTGGSYSNIRIAGAGVNFNGGLTPSVSTNIVVHSLSSGSALVLATPSTTWSNVTLWRTGFNAGSSLSDTGYGYESIYDNVLAFGNARASAYCQVALTQYATIRNSLITGDVIVPSAYGICLQGGTDGQVLYVEDTVIGSSDGIYATGVVGIVLGGDSQITLKNVTINNTSEVLATGAGTYGFVCSQRHDGAVGNHRCWYAGGLVAINTTPIAGHTQPYEQLTPISASVKLLSSEKCAPVDSGGTATFSVYTYKSAAYNGNQPRLVLKRNITLGIDADTVLATGDAGTEEWDLLSGATTPATEDDGVVCVYVDADGTAGTLDVDSWAVE